MDFPSECKTSLILNFRDVKKMAVTEWSVQLFHTFEMLRLSQAGFHEINSVRLPNNIFKWEHKHLSDRVYQDQSYLNYLENRDKEQLQIVKICTDLAELSKFVKILLKDYKSGDVEMTKSKEIVRDCYDLITSGDRLRTEIESSKREHRVKVIESDVLYRMRILNVNIHELQNDILDISLVIDPIILRYKRNYHVGKNEENEWMLYHKEETFESRINDRICSIENEDFCHASQSNMFNIQIEYLKRAVDKMILKYDEDCDKVDNDIAYKQLSIRSMKNQIKDKKEQMKTFPAKIEAFNERVRLRELKRLETMKEIERMRNKSKANQGKMKKEGAKSKK